QQAVAEVVRKQEYAMASQKPRSVDDISSPLANQLDQIGEFLGRIFEIGILNHDEISANRAETGAQRRAFAAVFGLQQQGESQLALQSSQHVAGAIGRAVIDDDQLRAKRHGEHTTDDLLDRRRLVVYGHGDRTQRIGQDSTQSR